MSPKRIGNLLNRLPCVSSACDLDVLLFFRRHPRAVLPTDRLALYVGYEVGAVAKSLEVLIGASLLSRVQGPTRNARMYVLTSGGPFGGWRDALLRLASTRAGRLAVLAALSARRAPSLPLEADGPALSFPRSSRQRRRQAPGAMEVRNA